MWFQQEGITSHTAIESLQLLLQQRFNERKNYRLSDVNWQFLFPGSFSCKDI